MGEIIHYGPDYYSLLKDYFLKSWPNSQCLQSIDMVKVRMGNEHTSNRQTLFLQES